MRPFKCYVAQWRLESVWVSVKKVYGPTLLVVRRKLSYTVSKISEEAFLASLGNLVNISGR